MSEDSKTNTIEERNSSLDSFLNYDGYISAKMRNDYLTNEEFETIDSKDFNRKVYRKNEVFFKNTMNCEVTKNFFTSLKEVYNFDLSEDQKKAVLCDEESLLITGGAGTGKTVTLLAKIKYLVDVMGIEEDKIIVLSFYQNVIDILKNKLNSFGLGNIKCDTIISSANSVIVEQSNNLGDIKSDNWYREVIFQNLYDKIFPNDSVSSNDNFLFNLFIFFKGYISGDLDYNGFEKCSLDNEFNIFLENYEENLEKYRNISKRKKISFKGNYCDSIQETEIANILYENSIQYVYHPYYKHRFEDSLKSYNPDFLITLKNNEKYYYEHFGKLGESFEDYGDPNLAIYKDQALRKIENFKKHDTKCFYTFGNYKDKKSLKEHLLLELNKLEEIENNRELNKKIARHIYNNDKIIKFESFISLTLNFIKKHSKEIFTFDDKIASNLRTKFLFVFAKGCYWNINSLLTTNKDNVVDDIVKNANSILKSDHAKLVNERGYEYIFIDEFQDLSKEMVDYLKNGFNGCNKSKIIAVGDDWQSINGFNGADLKGFKELVENVSYSKTIKLEDNFRNPMNLNIISRDFVNKDDNLIEKALRAFYIKQTFKKYVIEIAFYDEDKAWGQFNQVVNSITKSDDYTDNSSILLLGRTVESLNILDNNDNKKEKILGIRNSTFIGLRLKEENKKLQLNIKSSTVHGAKGIEADYVIILAGERNKNGFPNVIFNDLSLNIPRYKVTNDELSEERRVFYVALTRARKKVYILCPSSSVPEFIKEIINNKKIAIIGKPNETKASEPYNCPWCNKPLKTYSTSLPFEKLYVCQDPECQFMTNSEFGRINGIPIERCTKCNNGYLIGDKIFNKAVYKCTDTSEDRSGCNKFFHIDEKSKEIVSVSGYMDKIKIISILHETISKNSSHGVMATSKTYSKHLIGDSVIKGYGKNVDCPINFGSLKDYKKDDIEVVLNALIKNSYIFTRKHKSNDGQEYENISSVSDEFNKIMDENCDISVIDDFIKLIKSTILSYRS